jgi:hypothetical protein
VHAYAQTQLVRIRKRAIAKALLVQRGALWPLVARTNTLDALALPPVRSVCVCTRRRALCVDTGVRVRTVAAASAHSDRRAAFACHRTATEGDDVIVSLWCAQCDVLCD